MPAIARRWKFLKAKSSHVSSRSQRKRRHIKKTKGVSTRIVNIYKTATLQVLVCDSDLQWAEAWRVTIQGGRGGEGVRVTSGDGLWDGDCDAGKRERRGARVTAAKRRAGVTVGPSYRGVARGGGVGIGSLISTTGLKRSIRMMMVVRILWRVMSVLCSYHVYNH